MGILNFIFGKKKKKTYYPYRFAIIKYSDSAKMNGLFYDENKKILIYEAGELIYEGKYSKEEAKLIEEEGTPIVDEPFDKSNFNFLEAGEFGEVTILK